MNNIRPVNVGCLAQFPLIDESFDAITEWELLQNLSKKVNELISFTNTVLTKELSDYIDMRFNDIMIDSSYDSETETIVLFLKNEEKNEKRN